MFGLFKSKEIDPELLKDNVSETIIDIWLDTDKLEYEKFDALRGLSESTEKDQVMSSKFQKEKLRLTVAIACNLLSRASVEDSVIDEIIDQTKSEASKESKEATKDLKSQAKEYAEIRFSTHPRDAGRMIEDKFSRAVFGFVPSEDNVDSRYDLYKALSSFERSSIFEISSVMRKSRI